MPNVAGAPSILPNTLKSSASRTSLPERLLRSFGQNHAKLITAVATEEYLSDADLLAFVPRTLPRDDRRTGDHLFR